MMVEEMAISLSTNDNKGEGKERWHPATEVNAKDGRHPTDQVPPAKVETLIYTAASEHCN